MRTLPVLLVLLHGVAMAAEPVVRPPQKVSEALFKEVLAARDISFQPAQAEWSFDQAGASCFSYDESPGVWGKECRCKGAWKLSGSTLSASCQASCKKTYTQFNPRPAEASTTLLSVSLRLVYVDPTLTVFVHDGKPWTSAACADRPRCSRTRESAQVLVQLVPGAGGRALFDAVKAAFEAKGPQGDRLVYWPDSLKTKG